MLLTSRRRFLAGAAALAAPSPVRIIDTHTHFYDPSRPQGVPWPSPTDKLLYRTVLPPEFKKVAQPLGVVGTVVVEASAWVEDNQWVLDLAARDPFLLGLVGNLQPGQPEFGAQLARFVKNPKFVGIRVNAAALRKGLGSAGFLDDLRRLKDSDRELDVVGGGSLLADTAALAAKLPDLRIVIDHLPFDSAPDLDELAGANNVYAKISNVLRKGGSWSREAVDHVWTVFGERRVIYGSNWPVSDRVALYADVLRVVQEYCASKSAKARDNYFWRNALSAYRPIQPPSTTTTAPFM
jgi:predicted TIM-barrel fold metal-dependent hydrolase